MTQYTVKYDLEEREEAALRELLPCYQQYIAKDSSRPFEDYTLEDVFQSIMYIGSRRTIWEHIKEGQAMNKLISIDQLLDRQYLTIAERNAHTDEGSEDTWQQGKSR